MSKDRGQIMSIEPFPRNESERSARDRENVHLGCRRILLATRHMRIFGAAASIIALLTCLMCACQTANVQQAASPSTPKMGQVVIQWPTEQAPDVYGFNIYRSDSSQGPFTRVNSDIISAATGKGKDHYRYVDKPLELGRTYFYYIESISYAGQKKKISSVIPVNARP
jgi:hypothetical protein